MLNIPKFFEAEFVIDNVDVGENKTRIKIDYKFTSLRLNSNYVLYYTFIAKLITTLIIPFAILSILNILIF